LGSFLAGGPGRVLAEGFENSSGKSSSESKSSSSSSSEPLITALRSRTVDVGTGGDEEKMAGSAGGDDGGGGVREASLLDVLGCCGLCDEFGAGLKKLVMCPFLLISDLGSRLAYYSPLSWLMKCVCFALLAATRVFGEMGAS
jgi:hypothetical protein